MGQKINPVSLRLHNTNRHFDSSWYSDYFYKNLITRDIFLQQYLNNFLKLLKIPTGRYSIQHLQKTTQIYNFLCYSKSTREWRSRIFGLARSKNFSKKSRFFLKNQIQFKRRVKKTQKLYNFYTTLNQVSVHKIQKRISSFQNFQLWSTQINKSIINKPGFVNNSLISCFNLVDKPLINKNLTDLSKLSHQLQQLEKLNPNFNHSINNLIVSEKNKKTKLQNNRIHLFSILPTDNSSLLFLQNLLVYKALKSHLKIKNNGILRDKARVISVFFKDKKKSVHTKNSYELIKIKKNLDSSLNLKGIDNFKNSVFRNDFSPFNLKYKKYLETSLSSLYKLPIDVVAFKVKNDWQYASYLADEIVYFLEKRIPFRRLKTRILKQLAKTPQIRGVRITCSGRVGGKSKKAQRAKTECIKYGQTPLQVFSSKIDFSVKTAFTSFGSVGVKVWICYN